MRKITTYPKGRICKQKGCLHKLSIYNSTNYCNEHSEQMTKAELKQFLATMIYGRPGRSSRKIYHFASP